MHHISHRHFYFLVMANNLIFVPGRKKNTENPILDGYRFVMDKKKNDATYWKCSLFRSGCRARIITVEKQLTTPVPEHSQHGPQQAESTVHVLKQTMKKKAVETDLPTKRLACDAVSGISFEARAKLGCHPSSLSRMARRTRQAADKHPCNPRDLEHLSIPGDYILSHNNECMMLWDSGYSEQTRRSFLWGTSTNAHAMVDADDWIMDGTFKSSPNLFKQLFTIHGLFPDGLHLPLFYGLLPGKTTTLYKNLFEEVDTWGPYQPSSILMDFELAIHNAVAEVWPSSTRRGCNFHFKQSLLKHIRQCDLMDEYKIENSPIRDNFAKMGAIAFVPEHEVDRVWRYLKPLLPADMMSFTSYFEATWIGTSSTPPTFSHDMWNQHDASLMLLPRSSNIAEGWHHGFHSMLSCSNPTLWKFLDALKAEQALTDVKLTRRQLRDPPEPRAPKWIKFDRRLQKIVEDFDTYTDALEFLSAIGNLTMLS